MLMFLLKHITYKIIAALLFLFIISSCSNCFAQDEKQLLHIIETTKNDSIKSNAYSELSMLLYLSNNEEAIVYGLKAKEIAEKSMSPFLKENAYRALGVCYDISDDITNSYAYYRKAIASSIIANDVAFQANIYQDLAITYRTRNKLDSSLFYNLRALEIRKQLQLKDDLAASYNGLGLVYRRMNDCDNAIENFVKASRIYEQLKDENHLCDVMKNLALAYRQKKDYPGAVDYFKKAAPLALKLNDAKGYTVIRLNTGLLLNDLKRYSESYEIFNSLADDKDFKASEEYPLVVLGLGIAAVGVKKYNQAIEPLNSALKIKYKKSPLEFSGIANQYLSEAYEGLNNYNLALKYYKDYRAIADSQYSEENTKNVNELSAKYKTKEKEQEIILLNKDNQLKDLSIREKQQSLLLSQLQNKQNEQAINLLNKEGELKDLSIKEKQQSLQLSNSKLTQQQQQVTILNKENILKDLQIKEKKRTILFNTLGMVFISIVAIGILYLYRNKRKTSKQLEEKNNIISHSLKEKEVLLKEIHHRVKNNLQVISSLLNLQSKNISDEKALLALNEGRNRVKSMALIHQNLYRDDNLMGVDLQDYIEKLAQGLFASYNIQPDKIVLETNIQKLEMDVDTVIPLGLILNELISNALKYAFEGREHGKLQIDLLQQDEQLLLRVKDDGVGIPVDKDLAKSPSMGYKLIQSFLQKLHATMKIENNHGTNIELLISKYKLV